MKIKYVLLAVLVLVGLVVFVSATMSVINEKENLKQYNVEIQVTRGWNLIASGFIFASDLNYLDESGDIKKENIKAVYVYADKINEYISNYPKYDKRLYSANNYFKGDEQDIIGHSNWIYVDKSGILKYRTKAIKTIDSTKLYSGWNFVSITPDITIDVNSAGPEEEEKYTFSAMKGNCDIRKVYFFDNERQSWINYPLTEELDKSLSGFGVIVKVSSNCKMGSPEGTSVMPPPLPDTVTNLPPETNPETNNLDFPQTISEYTLKSKNTNDKTECGQLDGNNVCVQMIRIEYVTSDNRAVHILPTKITSGKESYINYIKTRASESNVGGVLGVYRGAEPWELYWFTNNDYDMVATQDYKYIPQPDGGYRSQTLNGTTTTSVAKWLLNKYPPMIIGNIQILEKDFGQLKFNKRMGQSYIEREYQSFPLNQMVQGDAVKYGTEVGVNVIIIEINGDKTSFLNKVLNVYKTNNWISQILNPPAYPRMYKLNYNPNSNNEIALWTSSNYLIIVHGNNVFVDGSDAEQIIEDYLNKYPSTL